MDPPSSRLRHSITMRRAAKDLLIEDEATAAENLSFDMAEVEMIGSGENLMQLATPFSKIGQVNYVTLKEQEKVRSDIYL